MTFDEMPDHPVGCVALVLIVLVALIVLMWVGVTLGVNCVGVCQ